MTEPQSPRLRTVGKVDPPYPLNQFPSDFGFCLGKELLYILATKPNPDIAGADWEQIFAHCIGAEWKPSNVGLDDIVLNNCAWSAKTLFTNPEKTLRVRLISGRNSPIYSYGETSLEKEPDYLGNQILSIWNERVSFLRKEFKYLRTVVLMKSKGLQTIGVFEFNTIRYEPELYYWELNKNGNLVGFDKSTKVHRFTWQPHGSQFTIIEDVPIECMIIRLRIPPKLDKEAVLEAIKFDRSWIAIEKRTT